NFVEPDAALIVGVNALGHRECRRELNRPVLAAANAFKNEHCEIVFHFIEVAAVPVAEFTLLIKECNRPPFAVATGEFRALDRMSGVENPDGDEESEN